MDPFSDNKISELKNKLAQAEGGLIKQNSLNLKREELESEIKKIEAEKAIASEKKVVLLNKKLAQLKKHLRELDAILDQLEDHSQEKVQSIRQQFIEKVLETYPERRQTYETLQQELTQVEQEKDELKLIYHHFNAIQSLLKAILEIRQKIRRWWILSYIFGANPNQIISQHLKTISQQIDLLMPHLNKLTYLAFKESLIELQIECHKHWGFRKMDTYFVTATERIANDLNKLGEGIKVTEDIESAIENKIKELIFPA